MATIHTQSNTAQYNIDTNTNSIPQPPPPVVDLTQAQEQYNNLGTQTATPTPTEYNFLLTKLYRVYYYSPLRPIIAAISNGYTTLTTLLTKKVLIPFFTFFKNVYNFFYPTTLVNIYSKLKKRITTFYKKSFKPAVIYILTTPARLVFDYPQVTAFAFALIFSFLVLFDYETDLLHTPHFPIYDPTSELGKAIATGRIIRRVLGGRTFSQYVNDKISVGDRAPTKQHFTDYYGPFVDELEWNTHYQYRDGANYHLVAAPEEGISEDELKEQIVFVEMKRKYTLLDEQFRQRELFDKTRAEVMDKIYNEVQWDLRDGTILGWSPDDPNLPQNMQNAKGYKPYKHVPKNKHNPIPHDSMEKAPLGLTNMGAIGKDPYWDKKNAGMAPTRAEFSEELLHYPNVTNPRDLRDRAEKVDQAKMDEQYSRYVHGHPPKKFQ